MTIEIGIGVEPQGQDRGAERESVFLNAPIASVDGSALGQFRIRNLSATGLLAEGPIGFAPGTELDVDLRNIGRVRGHVVWAGSGRFGLAFHDVVDPRQARKPVGGGAKSSPYGSP